MKQFVRLHIAYFTNADFKSITPPINRQPIDNRQILVICAYLFIIINMPVNSVVKQPDPAIRSLPKEKETLIPYVSMGT